MHPAMPLDRLAPGPGGADSSGVKPPGRRHPHRSRSIVITSPPARVIRACKFLASIFFFFTKRTEPSRKAMKNPSLNIAPSLGGALLGSYGISSGLVQGTAVAASATPTVLEV